MRRLVSMLAGLAIIATVFVVGFSGSGVTSNPSPTPVLTASGGGTNFAAPALWAVAPAPPALAEMATAPPPETECRPMSPLVPPCPESPPGMMVGVLAGIDRWRPLVAEYFEGDDIDLAMEIMSCESNGDPTAANPASSARGLFQHLERLWPERAADAGRSGADIFDPEDNIAVAAWLVYHGGGWSHWSASGHCW